MARLQYLQANFHLLCAAGSPLARREHSCYDVRTALAAWEECRAVRLASSEALECPVCLLSAPAAPQVGSCGHILCLPCALRLFASAAADDRLSKCPICSEVLLLADLRSVVSLHVAEPRVGEVCTFRKLCTRPAGEGIAPVYAGCEAVPALVPSGVSQVASFRSLVEASVDDLRRQEREILDEARVMAEVAAAVAHSSAATALPAASAPKERERAAAPATGWAAIVASASEPLPQAAPPSGPPLRPPAGCWAAGRGARLTAPLAAPPERTGLAAAESGRHARTQLSPEQEEDLKFVRLAVKELRNRTKIWEAPAEASTAPSAGTGAAAVASVETWAPPCGGGGTRGVLAPSTDAPLGPACDHHGADGSSGAEGSAASSRDAGSEGRFALQEATGALVFADPLSVRMLLEQHGSWANLPEEVEAEIVEIRTFQQDDASRRRKADVTKAHASKSDV